MFNLPRSATGCHGLARTFQTFEGTPQPLFLLTFVARLSCSEMNRRSGSIPLSLASFSFLCLILTFCLADDSPTQPTSLKEQSQFWSIDGAAQFEEYHPLAKEPESIPYVLRQYWSEISQGSVFVRG